MQSIELVDIDDVYPFEENGISMNPRDFSSKEKDDYIHQLAEQFKYNKLKPGQPRVNPILYRDGGIYMIIDGECRVRAMRLLGTKRFWADVYDDLDDAEMARREAAKAMVETDAKLGLNSSEMSKGVQMMLSMDIPDEEVAAVSRIDEDTVRKVRRSTKMVGDEAYDMTIDRLMAISELDDPQDVKELSECSQKDWRKVYEGICERRKQARIMADMKRILDGEGIQIVDEIPGGYVSSRTFSAALDSSPAALGWALNGIDGESCLAIIGNDGNDMLLTLLIEAAPGVEVTSEDQERSYEKSLFYQKWDERKHARNEFIAKSIQNVKGIPRTAAFTTKLAMESPMVDSFQRDVCEMPQCEPSALSVAIGYLNAWRIFDWQAYQIAKQGGAFISKADVDQTCELLQSMVADGYEASNVEIEVLRKAKEMADEEQ